MSPEGSRVARCVHKLVAAGRSKVSAIRICQDSTGQSYQTGKPSKARARTRRALKKSKH